MGFTASPPSRKAYKLTSTALVHLLVHTCHFFTNSRAIHICHDFIYSILAILFHFIPLVILTVRFFPTVPSFVIGYTLLGNDHIFFYVVYSFIYLFAGMMFHKPLSSVVFPMHISIRLYCVSVFLSLLSCALALCKYSN